MSCCEIAGTLAANASESAARFAFLEPFECTLGFLAHAFRWRECVARCFLGWLAIAAAAPLVLLHNPSICVRRRVHIELALGRLNNFVVKVFVGRLAVTILDDLVVLSLRSVFGARRTTNSVLMAQVAETFGVIDVLASNCHARIEVARVAPVNLPVGSIVVPIDQRLSVAISLGKFMTNT